MFPATPAHRHSGWQKLQHRAARDVEIAQLLGKEPQRVNRLTTSLGDCYLDLSRQSFDLESWDELCCFARARQLPDALSAWFYGEPVNESENRAACHQLYRHDPDAPKNSFSADSWDRADWPREAVHELQRMQNMAARLRDNSFLGATGKPLKHVITVGIGGSHLGVEAAYQALAPYHLPDTRCSFVANIDPLCATRVIEEMDLASCALVFSSKSGTTLESLANLALLKEAFKNQGIANPERHMFGISANSQALQDLGFLPEQSFTFPPSIGGRYSLFSPIGFALACCVDPQAVAAMRQGAADMDAHTMQTDIEHNMPIMLALASLWQHAVKDVQQHAILAYSHGLRGVVQHLQQLVMESNGKSVTINGEEASLSGEIIWGGENSNGQHSYFQLLYQGNRPQHCDMLVFARSLVGQQSMQDDLNAMALGQAQALTFGNPGSDRQRATNGNLPLSVIACRQLDAYTLGLLLALYENRTIAYAALTGINPFDQWGVEHGKACASKLARVLQGEESSRQLDSGLAALVQQMNRWRTAGQ